MEKAFIEKLHQEKADSERLNLIMSEIHAQTVPNSPIWDDRIPVLTGIIKDQQILNIKLIGNDRSLLDIDRWLHNTALVRQVIKAHEGKRIIFKVTPLGGNTFKDACFHFEKGQYYVCDNKYDDVSLVLCASSAVEEFRKFQDRLRKRYLALLSNAGELHTLPFITALNTNQIITLHGAPGTGKTTYVSRISNALGAKLTMIPVQNNWTDSSDLMGYYNPIEKQYLSTPFLDAILDAWDDHVKNKDNAHLHIICLDEMNLSRIEYYFATFLSLLQLEPEERKIQLLPRDVEAKVKEYPDLERYKTFILPPNVRFVGTLNFDETATIPSPKVVDRSFYIDFDNVTTGELKKQDIPDYIPKNFFEMKEDTEYTPDKNRNARHNKYASQMHAMAKALSIDEKTFKKLLKDGRPEYTELRSKWEAQMFGEEKK